MWLLFVATGGLAVLALRGNRWAYLSYVVLGLAYFPISVGHYRLDEPDANRSVHTGQRR